jgi:transposase InsO family protein
MPDICERENIAPKQVVLHSDNGSPMKGATMQATLQALGLVPSFSRPACSNDKALERRYAELGAGHDRAPESGKKYHGSREQKGENTRTRKSA